MILMTGPEGDTAEHGVIESPETHLAQLDGDNGALFDLPLDLDGVERDIAARDAGRLRGHRRGRRRGSVFVIPAKGSAIGGVVVAIGALTALVLVANAENAEALATIALALAILAFVVQILVFIAQGQAASQQMVQSEQLNTQTRALLTEVQTSARSTERMVGEQFRDLLKAFVESNDGGKLNMDMFERRLMETLERRMTTREVMSQSQQAVETPASAAQRSRAVSRSTVEQQRRMQEARVLRIFPTESEGTAVLGKLKALRSDAREKLQKYLVDEITAAQRGGYVGLPLGDEIGPEDQMLIDHKFIAKARVTAGGHPTIVGRLTDEGRIAGRILVATGEIPAWLAPELPFPSTT
jgi:hypothetical protein